MRSSNPLARVVRYKARCTLTGAYSSSYPEEGDGDANPSEYYTPRWLPSTPTKVDGPLICQSYVRREVNDHPLTLTPEFGPGVTPGARLTRVVSLCVGPAGAAPLRRKRGGVIRDDLE
ncbi:hypothetical protein Tco_0409737 [Tanacetum coccineum]